MMLPIPVPIIGSNKRLVSPWIYLLAVSTICYFLLIAFIQVHEGNLFRHRNSRFAESIKPKGKYKRNTNYTNSQVSSSASGERSQEPKIFKSVKVEDTTGQYATRRSDSTQVWAGHQDRSPQFGIVDRKTRSFVPWPNDQQCSKLGVRFAKKNTFKPRALVSYPGSGNSWLRYLIECSTGIFTGSVFHDPFMFSCGLLGENRPPNDGSTIVQKTHHDTTYLTSHRTRQAYVKLTELVFGYRGILLVRNPYDALVAHWNFLHTTHTNRHIGLAPDQNFTFTDEWRYFVTDSVPRWASLITSWVENSQSLLIVVYEKLKKNPRAELIRILEYLDQPVNETRLNCLLKVEHIEGPFHRRHHHNDSFNSSEENFVDSNKRNSELLKNEEDLTSTTVSLPLEKNISVGNHYYYEPSLDLIIQNNIQQVNRFLRQKDIPIQLEYSKPSC